MAAIMDMASCRSRDGRNLLVPLHALNLSVSCLIICGRRADNHTGPANKKESGAIMYRMTLEFAVIADEATVDQNEKLTITGIFDQIGARSFPFQHPSMVFVFKFRCNAAEFGKQKTLELTLVDQDGKVLMRLEGEVQLPIPNKPFMMAQQIIRLKNFFFPYPSNYALHLLVQGEEKASVPLQVIQVEESNKA